MTAHDTLSRPIRVELAFSPAGLVALVAAYTAFLVIRGIFRTARRRRFRAAIGSDTTQEIMDNLYGRYGKYWDDDESRLAADIVRMEEGA